MGERILGHRDRTPHTEDTRLFSEPGAMPDRMSLEHAKEGAVTDRRRDDATAERNGMK
jgi:hypothetical protein